MKRQWMLCVLLGCCLLFGGFVNTSAAQDENEVVCTDEESFDSDIYPACFIGENLYIEGIMNMDESGRLYMEEELSAQSYTQVFRMVNAPAAGEYYVDFCTKDNYTITTYAESGTGNEGYVCGKYGADAAYLGMVNGQVKFMLAGVIGFVDPDEVKIVHKDEVSAYSYYEVVGNNLIHRISTDLYADTCSNNLNNGPAPKYLKSDVKYYSYDGHYFYEDFEVMIDDYMTGFRDNAVNPETPFFNYFQFLPLRSYTELTGEELNEIINLYVTDFSKLKDLGETFVEMQNQYGVNALLAVSAAANESNWGKSNIAQTKNNLFGINANDATPGQSANYFKTTKDCVKQFTGHLMSKLYSNPDNWRYNGLFLGNKASGVNVQYASDPYWGEKIAAIAWNINAYENTMFDKSDAFIYTIGVKDANSSDHTNMNIRREPSSSSARLYRTGVQPGHAFIILDKELVNGYYKIQSEPVLNYSRTAMGSTGDYSRYSMYAYGIGESLTIVSEGTKENVNKVTFKDVPEDSWFYSSVEYVVENGIMAGLTYDSFGPSAMLTRSQLPVLLYRLEGEPEVEYKKTYKDVADGTWYTDAILWASENGIVTGYKNGTYGINDSITREQIAVMMYRYALYKGYATDEEAPLCVFKDDEKISDYAWDALSWAVGSELLFGKEGGNVLDPQGVASRSEGAAVFMRFMKYYS